MRIASRSRSSQRSSGRQTLSDSSDNGNATPRSSSGSSDDVENRVLQVTTPTKEAKSDGSCKIDAVGFYDNTCAPHRALPKFDKSDRSLGSFAAKSSPLKRSDGTMNLDQANLGSPSAKRRSIHGSAFGPDFDIFDPDASFQVRFEVRNGKDGPSREFLGYSDYSNVASPLPKRTPSLRRTTLQQRHDKPAVPRSKLNMDFGLDSATPGHAIPSARLRMSLDNYLPSAMSRDSPFSTPGSLPNASVHPISQQNSRPFNTIIPAPPHRHPLSRTITQSSSSSSMAEDSPTHAPVRQPEHRRGAVDFSKSLPVGATRPGSRESILRFSGQASSNEASFSTPENYKLAKPLPAAFMSTGLISKRHKDIEESQPEFYGGRSLMPDTPCKRHSMMEASPPPVAPDCVIGKTRNVRHSFGTPSTPFSPHAIRPAPGTFGKGVSIFGSNFKGSGINRRGSFLSIDGDDHTQSPPTKLGSQSSNEFELPPTPTKQALASSYAQFEPIANLKRLDDVNDDVGAPIGAGIQPSRSCTNCKSIQLPLQTPSDADDNKTEKSPSVALRFRSYSSIPSSFTSSRFSRKNKAPSPLLNISHNTPSLQAIRYQTKPCILSPASPVSERVEPLSPHTPRDSMVPPDPSGLSISGRADGQPFRKIKDLTSSASFPPATPTTSRDHFVSFGNGRSSLNSSHGITVPEVDPSLKSKFDKVELIGTGEFSHVYRVTQAQESKVPMTYLSLQSTRGSPKNPMPDRVWAVKKSRHPYIGPKDRQRKQQEVTTLKALGQSDHTVRFFDSWEDKSHLYIQTEFCEEGSLDLFLGQVGRKARLDDFRIWKIMLELSLVSLSIYVISDRRLTNNQGLKHIHDSGFIHLDLKPANVLITFEGVLKIGDFGMATQWPAQPGIEGEGDREYIGPEILKGQFDKPSDIFALGLIMLEIAGNVMLPENGASWQRLRSGDMTDVPSLTWSSDTSTIFRDPSGKPVSHQVSVEDFYGSDSGSEEFGSPNLLRGRREERKQSELSKTPLFRTGELAQPPNFMVDANHPEALDNLVRWMISPESDDRPKVDQILAATGVRWAAARRRAGATIYEGNWGPADEVLADDAEMIDV